MQSTLAAAEIAVKCYFAATVYAPRIQPPRTAEGSLESRNQTEPNI